MMNPAFLLLALTTAMLAADFENGDMSAGDGVPTGWEKTWSPPDAATPATVVRDT